MMKVSRAQKRNLDLLFGGMLIGSAMTFGLITLGYTAYRDSVGVHKDYQSSVPTRPQDIHEDPLDELPNPPYVEYLEIAPPCA